MEALLKFIHIAAIQFEHFGLSQYSSPCEHDTCNRRMPPTAKPVQGYPDSLSGSALMLKLKYGSVNLYTFGMAGMLWSFLYHLSSFHDAMSTIV
jgi:hypothetical protein